MSTQGDLIWIGVTVSKHSLNIRFQMFVNVVNAEAREMPLDCLGECKISGKLLENKKKKKKYRTLWMHKITKEPEGR